MKKRQTATVAIGSGLFAVLFFVAASWMPLQPYGGFIWLEAAIIGTLVWMVVIAIAVVSLPLCIPKRTRGPALRIFMISASIAVLSIAGIRLGGMVRMNEFERLAERSLPLVRAIESFVETENRVPDELGDLVPEYLAEVPKTGMGAYPDYEFVTSKDGEATEGNDWILRVDCPLGFLNWDQFLYFPNGNYPEFGYGGYLVPVGDWAYVHE